MKVKSLSHVRLLATPWTTAYQAPLSMGFSRQEYWSGLSLPSPDAFPTYLHLTQFTIPLAFVSFPVQDNTSVWLSFSWSSVQFSSVTQSCPTLCNPMNHSLGHFFFSVYTSFLNDVIQTHGIKCSQILTPKHVSLV